MSQGKSKFKLYSTGIAATNKALNSKLLEIFPVETLPYTDGELSNNIDAKEAAGVDGMGNSYQVKVHASNVLTAEWIGATHRRTAPDVRRGERVWIWQYEDVDKFYWSSQGRDDHLRKLETVIWTFSDTADEGKDSTQPGNCYYLEVSTHRKHITLQTAKGNGEPYAYTMQLNTGTGEFFLQDDVGNVLHLDSAATLIEFINRMGTFVKLDKRNININAPDNITAKAGKNVSVKAGQNIAIEAGQNINNKAGATFTAEGGAGAYLKSGGVSLGVTPSGIDMTK